MTLGLRSVELVLLAPLGYPFVSVFAGFVEAMAIDGDNLSVGFRATIRVKSLATSLLISVIATNFVGRILEGQKQDVRQALIEVAIFVVLVAYLAVLERASSHHAGQRLGPDWRRL